MHELTLEPGRLLLSGALKRQWRVRVRKQAPPPFLADIESQLARQQQAQLRRKPDCRQLRSF
jgi:predicted lysophospholipase L1 biosynthesis ABC-type transport system permease subunit